MKNLFLIPLLSLLILATGCHEAANEFEMKLVGTWEMVGFNEYLGLDYVEDYTFHQNGSYVYRHSMREVGERQPVGLIMIERGNYSYNGTALTKTATFMGYRPYDESFVPEDRLNPYPVPEPGQFELILQNDNQEFLIPGGIVGGDVIVRDKVYVRVE
ncbi:hypothetical protein [Litoribacter populi]|uniref:hypothetical protein n=1 Tax=Litoribacter populi TaxID=2598460 RepID=UPI00117DC011|nr:hypothetical protein [Litoribacter populi]